MGEKGLMEEDWNDRSNWRKKIIVKRAQEDVETSHSLLIYIYIHTHTHIHKHTHKHT
jgi:hypothetical protein